jgi:uncharacterized alkaline shock family protein YloU
VAETATATAERISEIDLPAPEHRGTLQIETRVIAQIARQAAVEVAGVVPYSVTLGSLTGRNLPRALADSDPRHPAIKVEIAIMWPTPATEVSDHVQHHVIDVVTRLTGRRPARVDVEVTEVVPSDLLLREEVAGTLASEPESVSNPHDRAPRTYPAAGWLAPMLGLLLVAAAVITGREYAVANGHYESGDWLGEAAQWLSDTQWQPWMVAVAVACLLVGLWLLYAAVRPRRRTHRMMRHSGGLWTRDTDVARRLSAIALDDPNTVSATTKVTAGRAHVSIIASTAHESPDLRTRLETSAGTLAKPPRVVVNRRATPPVSDPIDERRSDETQPERD